MTGWATIGISKSDKRAVQDRAKKNSRSDTAELHVILQEVGVIPKPQQEEKTR